MISAGIIVPFLIMFFTSYSIVKKNDVEMIDILTRRKRRCSVIK